MIHDLVLLLTIFLLAFTVGWELLGRVPPTLHLALTAGLAAISGVVVSGAAFLLQFGEDPTRATLGFLATFLASFQIAAALVLAQRLVLAARAKR